MHLPVLPQVGAVDAVPELARTTGVVMISAHDQPDLVQAALKGGASGYIRKDAEPTEVLRLVRRAAEGRTALSGDIALRLADALRPKPPPSPFAEAMATLTLRQHDVLALLAEGRTNREIAEELFLSEGTVKNHVSTILDAAGVRDRTKLAILYIRHQHEQVPPGRAHPGASRPPGWPAAACSTIPGSPKLR
jgi:DNA-binding NarL/FixJ family response regulator